ncbi:two-component regulator propeller domain-containing protein [Paucibacter sp. AS339]|uniref:two-component regulator propeller domain-containing protein n=1 Tax=Paucibacter hankyongi TaxID=3133434 RepID=UPI0030B04A58
MRKTGRHWFAGLLFVCLLGLGWPALVWAQAEQSLLFSHVGRQQGLPDGSVVAMHQDATGLMWLGTTQGLARWDGRQFLTFAHDPVKPDSLSASTVHSLFEQNGALWVGTDRGLDRLDLASLSIERLALPEDLAKNRRRVVGMAPRDDSSFWVATAARLLIFDWRERRFTAVEPGDAGPVRSLLSDGRGGVWYSHGTQVQHVDAAGRKGAALDLAAGRAAPAQLDRISRNLMFDAQQRLWVLLLKGVAVLEVQVGDDPAHPAALREIELPELARLRTATPYSLLRDSDGDMWVACAYDQGLWRWQARSGRLQQFLNDLARPQSLANNSLASLLQDRSGVLWVGTWGSGASLTDLQSRGFSAYQRRSNDPNGLPPNAGSAVLSDGAEHAWVGSLSEALSRVHLPTGQVQRFTAEQVGDRIVKALAPDGRGRLWVGGETGLTLFDPQTRSFKRMDLAWDSPRGASIATVLQDKQGNLWAGSAAGLYRFDPQGRRRAFRVADPRSGLINETFDTLLQDAQGRIWAGSKEGLHLWDESRERFVPIPVVTAEGRPESPLDVLHLLQARDARIWAATGRGLYQLVQKGPKDGSRDGPGFELQARAEPMGLPRSGMNVAVEDDAGQLWLGSQVGLIQVQWTGPERAVRVRIFPSGARHVGTGFGFGAVDRAGDGSLLFGSNGLLRVRPDLLRDNMQAPTVLLSGLRIFNRPLGQAANSPSANQGAQAGATARPTSSRPALQLADLGVQGQLQSARKIRLSHRESMVSFEFSALHFDRHELNRYAWQLQGFDPDWVQGQAGENVATYTNLDPGHYTLRVKAANPDGAWGRDDAQALSLEVLVLPPWWGTWWARLGALGLALLALAAGYRWRTASLRQTRLRLEGMVAKRTEDLLNKQGELQSQVEQTERARSDIAELSEMGRELGSSLDIATVVGKLHHHLQQLIDAEVFGVGLVDWSARTVNFDHVFAAGKPVAAYQRSLDAPEQPSAQCVHSGRELLISSFSHDTRLVDSQMRSQQGLRLVIPEHPRDPRSGIYVPLLIKGKVIGVISALSMQEDAYDAHDLDILRTLGAYAAVALENARAYVSLEASQRKLVEQEKLAALGSLVAGVAHELNTPIGNSVLIASTLRDSSREFAQRVEGGQIRRSDLSAFCEATETSGDLLVRSLGQAAGLVQSFKQVAADQTSEQRRCFDLQGFCGEVALTLGARIRQAEHSLSLDVPAGLLMDSYPGPLGQVISNLILNAMLHGFEGRKNGQMSLAVRAVDGEQVELLFSDNGKGIAARHLNHVFEPFFTTRLGQGGSGLGLHICYNIVQAVLGGSLSVSSEPGQGAQFRLLIPRVAPQHHSDSAAA